MKMSLSEVCIESMKLVDSKKNSGGPVCQIHLTATMTKRTRRHMNIDVLPAGQKKERHIKPNTGEAAKAEPEFEAWPPVAEKTGKLKCLFTCTELYLKGVQGNTLGEPEEVTVKVSLADGFSWKFKDPKVEENRTVRYSFTARSTDLATILLLTAYKFSSSSATSNGSLTYNKVEESTEDPDATEATAAAE